MNRFFSQKNCDRCGRELKAGRIMSMFNEDCICMECKDKERKNPRYKEAKDREHEEIDSRNNMKL